MRWPWVRRTELERVERLLAEAIRDRKVAEDRLYAAWREGLTVPPRETVIPREPKSVAILPDKLREYVENWEDPLVRMEVEGEMRRLHYELGYPEERVLETVQRRVPDAEAVL